MTAKTGQEPRREGDARTIIKAIQKMAQAVCEASPSGGCEGMEVLLAEEHWRVLADSEDGPMMLRLFTQGGVVRVRRAAAEPLESIHKRAEYWRTETNRVQVEEVAKAKARIAELERQ